MMRELFAELTAVAHVVDLALFTRPDSPTVVVVVGSSLQSRHSAVTC